MTQLKRALFEIEIMVTSQKSGFKGSQIIFGRHNGALHSVVARSYVLSRPAQPGERWRFTGVWDTDTRYINQVIASHGEPIAVQGERLAEYIVRHPQLRLGEKGVRVGKNTWKAAIEAAKDADKLAKLIDEEDREGIRALGVGRLTHNIELVLSRWAVLRGELEAVELLAKHQINKRLSYRLIKQYGETLPVMLRTDCYKMLAYDTNTKSLFDSCEKMADAMQYLADDPRRLQGVVDYILNYRLDRFGHTAIQRETLLKALVKHFKDESAAKRAIELGLASGSLQETPEGLLQSRPVAYAEAMLEKRFVTMIKTSAHSDKVLADKIVTVAHTVFPQAENPKAVTTKNKTDKQKHKIRLTDEQKSAIQLPFKQRLSIITGGAGTGKTTVISSVVRLAQALDIDVVQMALSGQAADVMRRYNDDHDIDCLSRTIHWYIVPLELAEEDTEKERKPRKEFDEFPENCLIVIDESSMIDLALMGRLLYRLPKSARIVMVGDPNQIPPVGAGLVFHLLCHSKSVPIAKLTQAHRSAAETGIPSVADSLSRGVVPELQIFDMTAPAPDHGVFFLPAKIDKKDQYCLAKVIYQVAEKLDLDRTQIITTHRKSSNKFGHIVQSIYHINEYFQSQLTSDKAAKLKAWGLNEGDPVIVRKNVLDVGGAGFDLFNGSLGRLTSAAQPYTFKFNDIERELNDEDIAKLGISLGYGLTVHSFQGSAAECVIIAVAKSTLLERSLLYTALTRAKKTVVFVGDQQAFNDAVSADQKWQTILTAFNVDRSFESE
jgi:exodeoxyribonuclease V alpha subunit